MTPRQRLRELLCEGPQSVEDLAARVGLRARRVEHDLEHVRRGVKPPERWVDHPARCVACGFVFEGRDRLRTPSRCPECRSEEIVAPEFEIQGGSSDKGFSLAPS